MNKQRPILLQGAMEVEIKYFKEVVSNLEEVEVQGYKFYTGMYDEYPIVISKTNVGLMEGTLATYIGITKFNPIAIINQGTAGGCSKNAHNYDIILGAECININSYITKKREETQGSMPLEWELLTFKDGKDELIKLQADNKLLNIALKCADKYNKGNIIASTIGSGDVWDNEIDRIKWFNEKYNVECEDMETISTYSVCKKLNIPVLGVRVISDNEILKEEYNKNIGMESQKYTIEVVKELIKSLTGE